MPTIALIAVRALNENARIAQTLGKHFAADVVQTDALANVTARLLDHLVAIDIGQQPQTEALRIGRIGETVHGDRRL